MHLPQFQSANRITIFIIVCAILYSCIQRTAASAKSFLATNEYDIINVLLINKSIRVIFASSSQSYTRFYGFVFVARANLKCAINFIHTISLLYQFTYSIFFSLLFLHLFFFLVLIACVKGKSKPKDLSLMGRTVRIRQN